MQLKRSEHNLQSITPKLLITNAFIPPFSKYVSQVTLQHCRAWHEKWYSDWLVCWKRWKISVHLKVILLYLS